MAASRGQSAADYARSVQGRQDLDWLDLELSAFSGHRDIQKAIRRDHAEATARAEQKGARTPRQQLLQRARVVWILAVVAAPLLVAFYAVAGEYRGPRGSFVEADTALPLAGVLVALATVGLIVLGAVDRLPAGRRREPSGGLTLLVLATSLVVALIVVIAALRGALDDTPGWGWWLLLMLAHLPVAYVVGIGSGGRRPAPPSGSDLAEELPEPERDRISGDLAQAVAELSRRGLATPQEVERTDAALGELAVEMSRPARKPRDRHRKR